MHTYIICSEKRHTKGIDYSDLMPQNFHENPLFGMTPADDQYIYAEQALNWSEGAVTFGDDTFDEHSFDERMFDK